MMAAIRASELGSSVLLLEKNDILGRKLLLSGKGRCNLTNACELDAFLSRFSNRADFLRDAFKKFFNTDLISFFESRGLKLKIERQLRVFPATDRSSSVVDVLAKELKKNKVDTLYNNVLKSIVVERGHVMGILTQAGEFIKAERIILATGGSSYRFTGSSGEGFDIAKSLGHSVIPLRAGLVPLDTKWNYNKLLEGLTLKNIRLDFSDGKKHIYSDIGELLFTGSGISGPLVLSLSGRIVDWMNKGAHISVAVDLKVALSKDSLDKRLMREFTRAPKKNIRNVLKELLPLRLVDVFLGILNIPKQKQVSQITHKERLAIVDLLKSLRFDIKKALPLEEAMVTRGGILLKEINPRTMESRLIKGLYFAGEIMDVDADTGGFNLQAAFSTGYLAGESAALLP